jgi:hypothetical protein
MVVGGLGPSTVALLAGEMQGLMMKNKNIGKKSLLSVIARFLRMYASLW